MSRAGSDPDALATRLGDALAAAGPGDAELVAAETTHALTRFASSAIHQNVAEENRTVFARALRDGRAGVASSNDASPAGLAALLADARRLAEVAPETPDLPDLLDPAPVPAVDAWRASTAEADPVRRADGVRAVVDALAGDDLTASGSFSTEQELVAVANSRGLSASARLTRASLRVVAIGGNGMGLAQVDRRDVDDIDPAAVARRAGADAVRSADPRPLDPGPCRALLSPSAVRDVLKWMAFTAFGARSWINGTSFLAGALGEQSLSPDVTIVDDPLGPVAGLPFDFEGAPKSPVDLVRDGVNRGVCLDRVSAARAGMPATAHAPMPGSAHGGGPANVALRPGNASEDELLEQLGTGLLIRHFHYVNGFLDPRRALMTGMTRYGTFWVENGRIDHAVKNLRWTQSFVDALGADLVALGRDRDTALGGAGSTSTAPALLVARFHVTGSTG